jgi:chemotaxis protein MotB
MRRVTLAALAAALMLGGGIAGTTRPAMAQRVTADLKLLRTAFFARLREALAAQRDVQVVGDRFVIPAGLLFRPGGAVFEPGADKLLTVIAKQLVEFSAQIPKSTNWVLQVDGHTDNTPISTAIYPSNWEFSAARAIAVVRFLNGAGVPNDRLVAAGYSQYQPLSTKDHARNRRIELKLISR